MTDRELGSGLQRRIELNLFAVFEAVMLERNVTRAAARLAMTQPSVSSALGRLRRLLADPLFHRVPGGVEPTERALLLYPDVRAALEALRAAVAPARFDPATAKATVTLGLSDVVARSVLPRLIEIVRSEAPSLDLRVRPFGSVPWERALASGAWDMTLGAVAPQPPDIICSDISRVSYVLVVRRGHPMADAAEAGALSLDHYATALDHVLVSPQGDPHGFVDDALEAHGLRRRVALTVNQFSTALDVVLRSDLAAVISPLALADRPDRERFVVARPPVPLAPLVLRLAWHQRTGADPARRWLRERIASLSEAIGDAG